MDIECALPPIADYKWELYNINEDWTRNTDLSAKDPKKQKRWDLLKNKNTMYSL
jgi:hypothetical protein